MPGAAHILLLDEPTTFLDVNHQIQALNLIQALNREHGLTVVMALHDLNQASQYAERLVILHDGRIVEEGPPSRKFANRSWQAHHQRAFRRQCHLKGATRP